jgi:hypothetical protein
VRAVAIGSVKNRCKVARASVTFFILAFRILCQVILIFSVFSVPSVVKSEKLNTEFTENHRGPREVRPSSHSKATAFHAVASRLLRALLRLKMHFGGLQVEVAPGSEGAAAAALTSAVFRQNIKIEMALWLCDDS